jgi:hypothetical protein
MPFILGGQGGKAPQENEVKGTRRPKKSLLIIDKRGFRITV